MEKIALTERDICTRYITPASAKGRWEVQLQVPEQKRIVDEIGHLTKLGDELHPRLLRAEDRALKVVEAVVQQKAS